MTTSLSPTDAAALAAAPGTEGAIDERPPFPQRRPTMRSRIARVLTYAALTAVAVVFTYPFIWLVSASFKPRSDVFDNLLIPKNFTFENYLYIWQEAPIGVWLINSSIVTALAAITVTVSSALVAWGFAYFRFRGRGPLFALVIGTMMLPGAVTMIPTFLIWNGLGATGTLLPLWAGNLFGSAFYIFLLRQFFLSLPRELFEAAKIDGAGNWRIFAQVAMPLCRPALAVTLLFELQAAWTDLMRPLIYLRDTETFTVPRGLKSLVDQFGSGGEWHWEIIVTASVITTVPMIILFFIGQKQFVDGIATTGSKG
jgi:multiple sugar transport system permease protein